MLRSGSLGLLILVVLSPLLGAAPASAVARLFPERIASQRPADSDCPPPEFKTIEEARAFALNSQASCPAEGPCESRVGLIAAVWKTPLEVSGCTGFLVAPDILATNRHCLPGDLGVAGADCAGRLWIFFPNSNRTQERVECATVISSTEESDGRDVAFLQLKTPVKHGQFPISKKGFPDAVKLKLVKMNPGFGPKCGYRTGTQQSLSCVSRQKTEWIPSYQDSLSPLVTFSGCEIMEGNSGSPLLDERDRVIGVLQAYLPPLPREPDRFQSEEDFLAQLSRPLLNLGTNLACVHDPLELGPVSPLPPYCEGDFVDDGDIAQMRTQTREAILTDANRRFAGQWGAILPWVQWKATPAPPQVLGASDIDKLGRRYPVFPAPKCLLGLAVQGVWDVKLPIHMYTRGFNSFLQYGFKGGAATQTMHGKLELTADGTATLVVSVRVGKTLGIFRKTLRIFSEKLALCN